MHEGMFSLMQLAKTMLPLHTMAGKACPILAY